VWWAVHIMPIIPALQRLKQEVQKKNKVR
jgi:hypothetical protein